jgi:hypothetical protein
MGAAGQHQGQDAGGGAPLLGGPMFRIDYQIAYQGPDDEDFHEIGFGSTCGAATVNAALYDVESDIQNRMWETRGDMPDPSAVDEMATDEAPEALRDPR